MQNLCEVCVWLESVRKLDELITAKIAERDKLWAMATNMTANSDGMPHAKGNVSDPVGNGAVKLYAIAQEIGRLVDTYIDRKQQVIKTLEQLPSNEYGALHRHYIQYMTWEDVAQDMGKSEMQVYRYRKIGLEIIRKNFPNVIEC